MVSINLPLRLVLVLIVSFFVLFTISQPVFADASSTVCNGVGAVVGEKDCAEKNDGGFSSLAKMALNIFAWVIGVAAVFAIIYAGLQFMIANGDASKIAKAKNTILYAIVGLVIVALSQVIVRFVITST
jgi:Type IV secretion system pilin